MSLDAWALEAPSSAYGAVAPTLRDEPRRGIKVLAEVLLTTAVVAMLLAFGAGRLGVGFLDVDEWRRDLRARQVEAETVQMLAALPYADVAGFDGVTLPEHASSGLVDFRVDLAVTAVDRGLQVEVFLLDERTRLPVRQFVAWRGRG